MTGGPSEQFEEVGAVNYLGDYMLISKLRWYYVLTCK